MFYFITGASSGIGRACAVKISKIGKGIALFSRRIEILENLKLEIEKNGAKAIAIKGDVRNIEDLKNGMAEAKNYFGELDNLICAAGVGYLGPFLSQEEWQWKEMVEINTIGVINSVYCFLPYILRKGGKICIISSILGKMGFKNMACYSASKFSLHGFVQGLRAELEGLNIKITLVCPGTVETPFFEKADRTQIPKQSRFLKTLTSDEVAEAVINAMEKGKDEVIIPLIAKLFLKFHDIFPVFAEKIFYKL